MLKDAPRSFGAFNPENFDREFVGPIKATDALARSRNIPAVTLASELRDPTLYGFLKRAGVNLPRDEKFYGLALPLGGAEVTMEDLVRLYGALANGGELRPLRRTLAEKSTEPGERLISREAAFLTLEMLGQIPRPGTRRSRGRRDLLENRNFARLPRRLVGLGLRSFRARGLGRKRGRQEQSRFHRPQLRGALALPDRRCDARDRLRAASRHEPPPNANLRQVEFCAVSGQLPTAACAHRIRGWFIPGVSPISECEIHREILVDAATGLRVNSDDGTRAPRGARILALRFARAFRAGRPAAPHATAVSARNAGRGTFPARPRSSHCLAEEQRRLFVRRGRRRSRAFLAGRNGVGCGESLLVRRSRLSRHERSRHVAFVAAEAGNYKVIALDDHGRSDSRAVTFASTEGVTLLGH